MIKRQTPTRILPTRIGLERLHRLPSSVADTVTTRFGFLGFCDQRCERAVGIDPNDRHDFDDGGGDAPGTASTLMDLPTLCASSPSCGRSPQR